MLEIQPPPLQGKHPIYCTIDLFPTQNISIGQSTTSGNHVIAQNKMDSFYVSLIRQEINYIIQGQRENTVRKTLDLHAPDPVSMPGTACGLLNPAKSDL